MTSEAAEIAANDQTPRDLLYKNTQKQPAAAEQPACRRERHKQLLSGSQKPHIIHRAKNELDFFVFICYFNYTVPAAKCTFQ